MATKKKSTKKSVVRRYAHTRAALVKRVAEIRNLISEVDAYYTTPTDIDKLIVDLETELNNLIDEVLE